jgi:hypothetical protein
MPSGSAALLAKRLRLSRAEERCLTRLDLGLGDDDMTMLSGARWRQAVYYLGDMAALLFAVQSWRNGHALDASRLAEFTYGRHHKTQSAGQTYCRTALTMARPWPDVKEAEACGLRQILR